MAKINPSGTQLLYSGYVGGSAGDRAYSIAVDQSGNAYITGPTYSTESSFPVTVGPSLTFDNTFVVQGFIAKINSSGGALVYAGYIPGTDCYGIAIDHTGNAYVVGTSSGLFPVTVGPDLTHNGGYDALVAKINSSGTAFLYAGYIGGTGQDYGQSIAVDAAGNAYVVGWTTPSGEPNFPVTVGPDLTHNGGQDAFVAKVNPTGSQLVYAGYIGGSSLDAAYGIAVDPVGNAYVTGYTGSTESTFPVVVGPDLTHNGGGEDGFVAKIKASGTALVYSGYVGGSGSDAVYSVAVDAAGNAHITGETNSDHTTFPVTVGPDLTYNGSDDAFVTKIAAFPGTAGPNLAFRNGFNAIEMNTFPSPGLHNFGGNFRLNPAVAMSSSGRAFVAARDSAVGVWINFLKPDRTDNGWVFAGGNSPGQPALAVTGETAWIAVRDPWNSYYVRSYTPGVGFTSWTWLQGILATTPQIAGCPNGDVYITGKDNWNGVWTRRYSANLAAWQNWLFIGGIITGGPAITCGSDNAAYIAARDPSNNMWLARVAQESSSSWHYGEGIFQDDLHIAAKGNLIHVVGLSSFVPWYRTWEVGTGWQGWTSPEGALAHVAPAVYGNYLYLTGQTSNGNLWWWSSLSNSWTNFGLKNVATGSRFSAGAR